VVDYATPWAGEYGRAGARLGCCNPENSIAVDGLVVARLNKVSFRGLYDVWWCGWMIGRERDVFGLPFVLEAVACRIRTKQ
jgi:hypothetical protein